MTPAGPKQKEDAEYEIFDVVGKHQVNVRYNIGFEKYDLGDKIPTDCLEGPRMLMGRYAIQNDETPIFVKRAI